MLRMVKPMLTRVPENLHARVKSEAESRGLSMTQLVIEALEEYLSAVHVSADFAIDPRYDPNIGGIIAIKIGREELEKLYESWKEKVSATDNPEVRSLDGKGIP